MILGRYSHRRNIFSRQRNFWLEASALGWSSGEEQDRLALGDVAEVRLYRLFMPGGEAALQKKTMWRMHVHGRAGERVVLSPMHYIRIGRWEDRSGAYIEFATRLLAQLQKVNPVLKITAQQHWTIRLRRALKRQFSAMGGHLLLVLFRFMRNRDPDRTANAAARAMRVIGPWLRGHRVARENLMRAFPEKSGREIEAILQGMWDNLGRVIVEYAFLDRLWDFNPGAPGKRIVMDELTLANARHIRERGKPVLYFAAHLGNWELPPVAGTALGQNLAVMYRPPDFARVAAEIIEMRAKMMDRLIPAGPRAALAIKQVLQQGMSFGMLVDEYASRGIDVTFFGRPWKANPTLARLARRLDCAVHGSRAVRLPGGRFRIEITDAVPLPRDEKQKIDVLGTVQVIISMIESWIREHPEQWLWTHRRWR